MQPTTVPKPAIDSPHPGPGSADLEARYSQLFDKLRASAKGMVRRAFGSAFSDDDLDDLYSSAWLSTLAAFRSKPRRLSDEEFRRYLMTAVANQASRELRRRGRKPTVPIDAASGATDPTVTPDEAATQTEGAQITRDVLGTLPPRRRAVLVFRYGWGLQPDEVCGLVDGLSPRAYRKEIERGVAEIAGKMRLVEEGEWCQSREPLLRAVAAGLADDDQRRQAKQHLAHCRSCAGFVSQLSGHLHDLGGSVALAGLSEVFTPGSSSLLERLTESVEHARTALGSALGRGADTVEHATGQALASGGTSGAGAAGTGGVLAAAGGKVVAGICAGATATACVAAGVVPGVNLRDLGGKEADPNPALEGEARPDRTTDVARLSSLATPEEPSPEPQPSPPREPQPAPPAAPPPSEPEPAEPPPPDQTVSNLSPVVQDFEPVGTPAGSAAPSSSEPPSGGGNASSAGGDFGP